jgi:hypothetical protein
MAPFAEAKVGVTDIVEITGSEGHGQGAYSGQEQIQLVDTIFAKSRDRYDGRLEYRNGRYEPGDILVYRLRHRPALRLVKKHRQHSRRIDNHQVGSPCSS